MSGFTGRVGLHPAFYEPTKVGHLCVEAPVDEVTREIAARSSCFRIPPGRRLGFLIDQIGKTRADDAWPLVTVFQLQGLPWTQVTTDLRRSRTIELARRISESLATRVLAVEVTDDAYNTHLVLHAGRVRELLISATGLDVKTILTELGLPVPDRYANLDARDLDGFDEAVYAFEDGREGAAERDLEAIAKDLGCYLHYGGLAAGSVYGLEDAAPGDVVRLDVAPVP